MKSVSLLLMLGVSVATVATSCGGNPAPQNTTPAIDTAAENARIRDSITAELHEIGLLRGERLLHQPDGGLDGVLLRRPCSVTLGDLGLQRLDLELDFPDVAFERAPGKEPQA